jgi:mycothiol synthase
VTRAPGDRGGPDIAGLAGRAGTAQVRLRAAAPADADAMQAIWESSYAEDDPASWSRGGWSASAWATDARVLEVDGRVIGVAAVRAERAPDGAMPARLALTVPERRPPHPDMLVQGAVELIRLAGGERARLFIPSRAVWMQTAARVAGFAPVRMIAHMLLAASAPTPTATAVEWLRLRPIRPGEDERVLAALNRNWEGTWNFVSIPFEMLEQDLDGQREGMLLGVDSDDEIIATCHAVYEPSERNPDGYPRAWISNLTVDPERRQRGIARYMLAAGIRHLRDRGAGSITLGVDANDPAPFRLYQSVGFEIATSQEAWDKAL